MPYKNPKDKEKHNKKYCTEWYKKNAEKHKLNVKERKTELKKWFFELKCTYSCSECPENHPACIDFHHLRRKDRGVSEMVVNNFSKEAILKEISKCVPLCANCHRKLHFKNLALTKRQSGDIL